MKNQISLERIKSNLLEIGEISSRITQIGYSRIAYSEEEKEALNWLKKKAEKISFDVQVKQDKIGNVFVRYGSSEKKAIAFGSHLDTVPEGGLYDGALGVVLGLECLQTYVENNPDPEVPLELICFVGEEANPLGGTFGSRSVTGLIEHSSEFERKLKEFNYAWSNISDSQKTKNDFHCFLEVHIDQGPILESEDKKIGIVVAIAGLLRESVTVYGKASHSGTTPMNLRNDALLQASKLVQKVNKIANDHDEGIVATVGEFAIKPNLANVVPGEVNLVIEIRGGNWETLELIRTKIKDWSSENIDSEFVTVVEKEPNNLSETIQGSIESACELENISYKKMSSGANHDSMSMSRITETGMIFLPSKDGISHHPDEYTSWNDIEIGGKVMMQTIFDLIENFKEN